MLSIIMKMYYVSIKSKSAQRRQNVLCDCSCIDVKPETDCCLRWSLLCKHLKIMLKAVTSSLNYY